MTIWKKEEKQNSNMLLKDFSYNLPKKLIAQTSIKPRDRSRLLVLNRETKKITHDRFFNIGCYLKKGDVVVLNNTKVIPARLITNENKEVFLLRSLGAGSSKWLCLAKYKGSTLVKFAGSRLVGKIYCSNGVRTKKYFNSRPNDSNSKIIKFNLSGCKFWQEVESIGQVPTPPYIKRSQYSSSESQRVEKNFSTSSNNNLRRLFRKNEYYQTIFAKKKGSVAAPTAGFHFTQKLVKELKSRGDENW